MAVKEAPAPPAGTATEVGAGKGKGKKKLILLVGAVLLVVLGGGVMWFLMQPEGPKPPPEPGAVVKLDAVQVNLTDGHYLKLELALQTKKSVTEPPDGSKAMDIANRIFSEESTADLAETKTREQVKKHLAKQVIQAYEGDVIDVYFRQLVWQ